VNDARAAARGLVLIVFDTLRADFEQLAGGPASLPNFQRLRRLCESFPVARCGSFPTGPMRTDLLTGRLAFLDAEWALPDPGEPTLPRMLRELGVWTTLVTDNYVAVIPRLGGMLINDFASIDFIRGAGSDPWMTPSPALQAEALRATTRLPSRNVDFEIQYLANVAAWAEHGHNPSRSVFASAARQIDTLERHERFLLWIDSFATHEPWDLRGGASLPDLPLFPAYVEADQFPASALADWKAQYARRIVAVDSEIETLVDRIERLMERGDVALAVVSDHGFLFGEYGFVGKAPNTPLPPELHELVCWFSPHFDLPASVQPHALHQAILRLFGHADETPLGCELHVFGRNSPRSAYIAAATSDELYVGCSLPNGRAHFSTIKRSALDPAVPLAMQGSAGLPSDIARELGHVLSRGRSTWLAPFQAALTGDPRAERNHAAE
jgi:arylsulfatase A-like enzyme